MLQWLHNFIESFNPKPKPTPTTHTPQDLAQHIINILNQAGPHDIDDAYLVIRHRKSNISLVHQICGWSLRTPSHYIFQEPEKTQITRAIENWRTRTAMSIIKPKL